MVGFPIIYDVFMFAYVGKKFTHGQGEIVHVPGELVKCRIDFVEIGSDCILTDIIEYKTMLLDNLM